MDSRVFRKDNASSCLVVNKTWQEIVNKPDFFDELVDRVVAMMTAATEVKDSEIGIIGKNTTLRQFKEAVNKILLQPLQQEFHGEVFPAQKKKDSILADAFWDEILVTDADWGRFKDAIMDAYEMKQRIAEHSPLSKEDTFQTTKDNFTDTIMKPMLGINEDE